MLNKETVKISKFIDLKEKIENLELKYAEAFENNDVELMNELDKKYQRAQIELISNEYYFVNLKKSKLNKQIKQEKDKDLKVGLIAKKQQRKKYKDNKPYIDVVAKSENLYSLILAESDTKRRNFKKIIHRAKIILISTVIAIGGVVGLSKLSKNHKDSDKQNIKNEQVDDKEKDKEENISNEIKDDSSSLELDIEQSDQNVEDNYKDVDKIEETQNNNLDYDKESSSLIPSTSTTTTKELDPNIKNETKTIKKDKVVKETPIKEKKPVSYPTIEESPLINSDKLTTIEESIEDNPINPSEAAGDKVKDDDKLESPSEAAGDNIQEDNKDLPELSEELPEKEINIIIKNEDTNPINPSEAAGDNICEDIIEIPSQSSSDKVQEDNESVSTKNEDTKLPQEAEELPQEEINHIEIKEEVNAEDAYSSAEKNDMNTPIFYENMDVLEIDGEEYTLSYSNR